MKNIVRPIKENLWKLGLMRDCPWCGYKTEETGHPKEGWQSYRCTNTNCTFGK